MSTLLPFIFLISVFSIFGITWVAWYVDPDSAPWYIFALLVVLIFSACWGLLGTVMYFLRTRFYRRYSANWYFRTSFKMAFFISLFTAVVTLLAILQLMSRFNLFLLISAVILFAIWSYLGKGEK